MEQTMSTEAQKLIDEGVALLKQTTVGYVGHSLVWQNNHATKWWQGLDKLAQARAALDPAPPPPPPPVSGSLYAPGPWSDRAPSWTDTQAWEPSSTTLIGTLQTRVTTAPLAIAGYGVAIVHAAAADPTVTLTNTNGWGNLPTGSTFQCPTAAKPAQGTDGHLTVVQPDGSLVEMWKAVRTGGNWQCGAAGHAPQGAYGYSSAACRGSSFTLPAGLVDPDEVAAGRIPHALALVLSADIIRKASVFPSTDTDGVQVGPQYIPEGARLVLDPAASLVGLTALEKVVGQALKDYGAILVDRTGGPEFSLLAVAPETWTAFGQPDRWAALGYSGYPNLSGLVPLMGQMRVVKMTDLRLK